MFTSPIIPDFIAMCATISEKISTFAFTFSNSFLKIRERNNVSDVLVEITMFDDPDWAFSESILVITTASPEEVQSWFVEEIAPDECWEGWSEDTEHGWVEVPVGMHPVTCWWD